MSEVKSLRFNSPELETWVDEHIEKGELNGLMNELLEKYRIEQEQEYVELEKEEKLDHKITIFQGIVFLSVAAFLLVFSLSKIYDVLIISATYLGILGGVMLCIYVIISIMKNKKTEVS